VTGPRVVAVGGGHGLAATLRAVRRYAGDVTSIVSVADDGGSSGKLRDALGIVPPGDLRKCLVAMAADGSPWPAALEYRFNAGELDGHAVGNLLIAGLTEVTGDLLTALAETGRLLGIEGRVLPATLDPVVLRAEVATAGSRTVEGQVAVQNSSRISHVSLVPDDPEPPADALEAIAAADQLVIGPGSLYTSVLAVVAVPKIREALAKAPGRKVYVCNLRPQVPETEGYTVASHVDALRVHGLDVDVVLCDPAGLVCDESGVPVVQRPLAKANGLAHDPERLAQALVELT
jgi:uncharacterized cofD-like protein